jgi:septal ring factor EnvC (AmiA/AmiB activator)
MDATEREIILARLKELAERATRVSEKYELIKDHVLSLDKEVALLEQGMGSIRNDLGEHHIKLDDIEEQMSEMDKQLSEILISQKERERVKTESRDNKSLNMQQSSEKLTRINTVFAIVLGIITLLLTIYGFYVTDKNTELEYKLNNETENVKQINE